MIRFKYLIFVFISAKLAYKNYFRTFKKTLISAFILAAVLALSWKITFTIIAINVSGLIYYPNQSYLHLFIMALPECLVASIGVFIFFHFAPAEIKKEHEAKDNKKWNKLSVKITEMSILEALILCLIAMIVDNIFFHGLRGKFSSTDFLNHWLRINIRLGLMMISATVPIAYIFNLFIMKNIVRPINSMSLVMDRYFDTDDKNKADSLPDLDIHTGDEIEKLYLSLQKMVGDMSCYITQTIEHERKAAHLTQGFMLALAKAIR